MAPVSRRSFLGVSVGTLALGSSGLVSRDGVTVAAADHFPLQDPALVREMVGAAHGNLERVRELLRLHPALADVSIDWGFGDWESALGAAAHTGRREIAELLIAHGAAPTVFSAAMLGQLDLVKAFVATVPGIQRSYGAHSITLLAHARTGGERAGDVRAFLEQLGDADVAPATIPMTDAERTQYVGVYAFGDHGAGRAEVIVDRGALAIRRMGGTPRQLRAVGPSEFYPAGAERVRVRFAMSGGRAAGFTVHDPALAITATRVG